MRRQGRGRGGTQSGAGAPRRGRPNGGRPRTSAARTWRWTVATARRTFMARRADACPAATVSPATTAGPCAPAQPCSRAANRRATAPTTCRLRLLQGLRPVCQGVPHGIHRHGGGELKRSHRDRQRAESTEESDATLLQHQSLRIVVALHCRPAIGQRHSRSMSRHAQARYRSSFNPRQSSRTAPPRPYSARLPGCNRACHETSSTTSCVASP